MRRTYPKTFDPTLLQCFASGLVVVLRWALAFLVVAATVAAAMWLWDNVRGLVQGAAALLGLAIALLFVTKVGETRLQDRWRRELDASTNVEDGP
jgi:hypothetical protein